MYRLNPFKRNVLIMADEVIFHAPTKQTIDSRTIEQSIIVAEERFLRNDLGHTYYEALLAEKNTLITPANKVATQALVDASLPVGHQAVTLVDGDIVNASESLSADNKALWNQLLWKYTAECVVLLATSEAFIQFGSEGIIHSSPPAGPFNNTGVATPELRSVKWFMDKKMMDRIDPLHQALHSWLCNQKKADSSKYPLYDKYCDCDINGIPYKRKSDIILDIYGDEEDTCSC